ncbi:hemerythrin domain-containing protein [Blastococcus sp. CT_GayMR20]|uniref:hemerythrin domain-containing protein n=1 Tax=Blastococcus sp. CT_GayMR20 TaxID=2559609 RepID=UPI0010739413|nr:hemerythrin domain-containing protein [Blastococcus sp. CT_GayMR20]TFV81435.1 hemerythrin domain-containing protein [Blastococcus sp. CT_GayMR20]
MTEPMTMNRLIHGAVRRDLDRLSAALGRLPDGDRARAQDLQRAFANLRRELTHHHEGEDTYIWPMLSKVGVDPDLLSTMEAEHHTMAEALAETDTAMATVARTGSAADAAAARASVVRTQEVVNGHLAHEESELEPQLHRYTDTPEWKAVEKKLSRQPPGVAGQFFAWLTDGMSDEHRAFLRKTVPTPVVSLLAKLFGRRYNREIAPVWRASAPA